MNVATTGDGCCWCFGPVPDQSYELKPQPTISPSFERAQSASAGEANATTATYCSEGCVQKAAISRRTWRRQTGVGR